MYITGKGNTKTQHKGEIKNEKIQLIRNYDNRMAII